MVIYFSGTGNSRYCAELLAHALGDELLDSFSFIKSGTGADLVSQKPYVFVCPIYAWRIPGVFSSFIEKSRLGGDKRAYFVITCGSDIGNAAKYLQQLCLQKGLEFMGAAPVVMPENYIALFDSPHESQEERIMATAKRAAARLAAAAGEGAPFKEHRPTAADRLKSSLVNRFFFRFIVKAKKFRSLPGCTGCGICAEKCPLGNITLGDGRPVWGSACTHCMACIAHCPQKAIEYGTASVGRRRYLCRPFKPE